MIFPQWLNDAFEIAVQSAPVLILMVAAAVLWWRSLHPRASPALSPAIFRSVAAGPLLIARNPVSVPCVGTSKGGSRT
jgi:hypothetical protein